MNKIREIIKKIVPIDKTSFLRTQEYLDNLTKPIGSLGKLEDLVKKIVAITGKKKPVIKRKLVFVLAGDHGVTEEGISAYPSNVTAQMVHNFIHGGAGINVLSRYIGAEVIIVDIGVAEELKQKSDKLKIKKIGYGTNNFVNGPAMTLTQAIKSVETGIKLVENELRSGIDIIITGDMGIGNTTVSSAITSVITNKTVEEVTGKGTGITDTKLKHKIKVIEKAISVNNPNKSDPIDILHKIGGFEIGGLTGIILASAAYRIPIVLDGFISTTAGLLAFLFNHYIKDYLFAGHCSQEPGHKIQLEYLGLDPILNLEMRLGEGTGAVLATCIIEASCRLYNEMATFDSAGVSKKLKDRH